MFVTKKTRMTYGPSNFRSAAQNSLHHHTSIILFMQLIPFALNNHVSLPPPPPPNNGCVFNFQFLLLIEKSLFTHKNLRIHCFSFFARHCRSSTFRQKTSTSEEIPSLLASYRQFPVCRSIAPIEGPLAGARTRIIESLLGEKAVLAV
jgi:hypothetical protein